MSVNNLLNLEDVKEATSKLTKLEYVQRPPDKSVEGKSFEGSDITFSFTVSGNKWWIPSKTFFASRMKVGKDAAAAQPDMGDQLAPAPMMMSGMFSAIDFRIANKSIGRIGSYVGQIESCRKRLTKSKAWRESAGRPNFFEGDFKTRQEAIAKSTAVTGTGALGFDPLNTIVLNTDGLLTEADGGGTPLDLTAVFKAGEEVILTIAPNKVRTYIIASVPSASTIQFVGAAGTFEAITTALVVGTTVVSRRLVESGDRRNDIETMWQPPHAIFSVDTPQPPGTYSFVLSPNIGQKGFASIQTPEGVTWTDADVVVNRMLLYVATVDGETPPANYTHYLDLQHVNCQPQTMRPNTGEQNYDFVVSPSTYALTLATQEGSAGKNTSFPPQVFKQQLGEHLTIGRYRIQYAGQTQNSPDSDPSYTVDRSWLMKEYTDTQLNSNQYFQTGGCEVYEDWLNNLGPMYHKMWLKPAGDNSTNANVAISFGTAPTNANLLLFDWSSLVAKIEYRENRVFNVQVESA